MIENGKMVTLHYILKVNGEVIDESPKDKPLEFKFGSGGVIPGFAAGIRGLKPGDQKEFTVSPEDGYGMAKPDAIVKIDREKLPQEDLEIGMVFQGQSEDGEVMQGRVVKIEEDGVILDFNHPLASRQLDFSVEILEVK